MALPSVPTLPTGSAALVTASVIGTAKPVIYTAAVVLSGAGIGLADTGSAPFGDQETVGGGSVASVVLTPGGPGDSLLGFLHANLDPHTQPLVALVGQTTHG